MGSIRYKVEVVDGKDRVLEIHKIVVFRISMSDVEDPDLMIAEPIWNWQQTEAGKFIMENAVEQPSWHRNFSHTTYGYEYAIVAELEKKKLSEFYIRWGNVK